MLAKGDTTVQSAFGRNGKRVNVNQIPMRMLDLYFKKVSEDPANADSNGAYHFPPIDTTATPPRRAFESEYAITAIPSGTGQFI